MTPRITAFLLVLLVAACASPQAPTSMVTVPEKLKPGANESLAMIVPAKGVQSRIPPLERQGAVSSVLQHTRDG